MLKNGLPYCANCGSPMVSQGNGNFKCYHECGYTFRWEQKEIDGQIEIRMDCHYPMRMIDEKRKRNS